MEFLIVLGIIAVIVYLCVGYTDFFHGAYDRYSDEEMDRQIRADIEEKKAKLFPRPPFAAVDAVEVTERMVQRHQQRLDVLLDAFAVTAPEDPARASLCEQILQEREHIRSLTVLD